MKLWLYNRAGELEAEIDTISLATFMEFARDFRDAHGFVCLQEAPGGWEIREPSTAQSMDLQNAADSAAV